jgi:hypothetical protein
MPRYFSAKVNRFSEFSVVGRNRETILNAQRTAPLDSAQPFLILICELTRNLCNRILFLIACVYLRRHINFLLLMTKAALEMISQSVWSDFSRTTE